MSMFNPLSSTSDDGGGQDFVYKIVIFAAVITLVFPLAISIFVPAIEQSEYNEEQDVLDGMYESLTGTTSTNKSVWGLTGIYTPYNGSEKYNYTADGWLYTDRVVNYDPAQYDNYVTNDYTIIRYDESDGLYYKVAYYDEDGKLQTTVPEKESDYKVIKTLYSAVNFDSKYKSTVIFTSDGKQTTDNGFYYTYTGYRYAFQPLKDYSVQTYTTTSTGTTEDGKTSSTNTTNTTTTTKTVIASNTSLSMIWYDQAWGSGLAGQLVLSGSDSGVNYINSTKILNAFNNSTNTAVFTMQFNGIDMEITVRLDPYMLSSGKSVSECWNAGYWTVVIATNSVYVGGTGFAIGNFDIKAIADIIVNLFTFNMGQYGLTGWIGTVASVMFTLPLMAALIAIGVRNPLIFVVALIVGLITAMATWFSNPIDSVTGFFGSLF